MTTDRPALVTLSAKGIANLPISQDEPQFTFLVGDATYSCPLVIADFLSPLVARLHTHDPTVHTLVIKTADPDHCFPFVLSLGRGTSVSLTESLKSFFQSVGCELCNPELSLLSFLSSTDDLQPGNVISRLRTLSMSGSDFSCEASFAAAHFFTFSCADLEKVEVPVLQAILGDAGLIIGSEDKLFELIRSLGHISLLEFVRFEFLSSGSISAACDWISSAFGELTFPIWERIVGRLLLNVGSPRSGIGRFCVRSDDEFPLLESSICESFPPVLSMFRASVFQLLYRGSRDGFRGLDFHKGCDNHSRTIVLIQSENGSVFGGYIPVPWSSGPSWAADPTLTGFQFTLRNPHGTKPMIFPIKEERKENAIYCSADRGPHIGNTYVCNECNVRPDSYSCGFGDVFRNTTDLDGKTFLTGWTHFRVKELEVFELTT
jgi:hypothetical protein